VKHLLIWFVRAWRALLSPMYGNVCKYYPTCSEYGLEALTLHGAWKGSALTIWRVLRCNPWSKGGVDPVPGSELAANVKQWWGEPAGPESTDGRRGDRQMSGLTSPSDAKVVARLCGAGSSESSESRLYQALEGRNA
jgi:putative membrane protein insertion efficiency factor